VISGYKEPPGESRPLVSTDADDEGRTHDLLITKHNGTNYSNKSQQETTGKACVYAEKCIVMCCGFWWRVTCECPKFGYRSRIILASIGKRYR